MRSFLQVLLPIVAVVFVFSCIERRSSLAAADEPDYGSQDKDSRSRDPDDLFVPSTDQVNKDTSQDLPIDLPFDAGADLAQYLVNVGFGEFWLKVQTNGDPFERYYAFVDVSFNEKNGELAVLAVTALPKDGVNGEVHDPMDLELQNTEDSQMAALAGFLLQTSPNTTEVSCQAAHLNLASEAALLELTQATLSGQIGAYNEFTPKWTGAITYESGTFMPWGQERGGIGGMSNVTFEMIGLTGGQVPAGMPHNCDAQQCSEAGFVGNCSLPEPWPAAGICD